MSKKDVQSKTYKRVQANNNNNNNNESIKLNCLKNSLIEVG